MCSTYNSCCEVNLFHMFFLQQLSQGKTCPHGLQQLYRGQFCPKVLLTTAVSRSILSICFTYNSFLEVSRPYVLLTTATSGSILSICFTYNSCLEVSRPYVLLTTAVSRSVVHMFYLRQLSRGQYCPCVLCTLYSTYNSCLEVNLVTAKLDHPASIRSLSSVQNSILKKETKGPESEPF